MLEHFIYHCTAYDAQRQILFNGLTTSLTANSVVICLYETMTGQLKRKPKSHQQQQPQGECTTRHTFAWTFYPHSLSINTAVCLVLKVCARLKKTIV